MSEQTDNALVEQIANLLQETGRAHHEAFNDVDGADPEWPMWYAERLQQPLNQLLDCDYTQSEIIYHLIHLDREYAEKAPGIPWPQYYARYFVADHAKLGF